MITEYVGDGELGSQNGSSRRSLLASSGPRTVFAGVGDVRIGLSGIGRV